LMPSNVTKDIMQQFFALILVALLNINAHPIHVGLTFVSYNEQTGSLEIVHKIFIDDFDAALQEKYGEKLQLGTEWESAESEEFIQKYLAEHFELLLNGKAQRPNYIGKESDMEAVWVYQEIEDVSEIKRLEIAHSVLFEKFDDQKNIVHLEIKDMKRSFLLSPEKGRDFIEM